MATATAYAVARARVGEVCCHDRHDRELRVELLAAVATVVGFDSHVWLLTDPETSVGSSPLADVPFLGELPRAIRLKYLTAVNRWTTLTTAASLSAATEGEPSQSVLWRELLCRHGITDGISCVFRDRFGCWGFLDLWRADPGRPFTAKDVEFLAELTGPVTEALRHSQARTFADDVGRLGASGPAVLLLSPQLVVRSQTPSTERYLRVLVPPGSPGASAIPAGAYNVAAQLLATEAGVDANPALARVHLAGGAWLTMRAGRLEAAAPGDNPDIAVSIEPASAADRIAVFARAFGLSAREWELLGRLAGGADTREVARAMHLSENTVQDNLKSVFAKTGTRSRRLLLSRALGA